MTQPYQPTTGMSSMQARVLSVNGNLAAVQDQLGRQIQVRRDWMRAKGADMPQPGETWMITKEFGNTWSFGMLISASRTVPPTPPMLVMPNQAARDALANVAVGQMVFRTDSGLTDIYNGQSWHGMSRLNFSSAAITMTSLAVPASPNAAALTTIAIPDPGWPYQLAFSGVVSLGVPASTGFNLAARDGSAGGSNLIPVTSIPVGASTLATPYPLTGTTGILTGSRTVYAVVQCYQGSGGSVVVAGGASNRFYAEARPVP